LALKRAKFLRKTAPRNEIAVKAVVWYTAVVCGAWRVWSACARRGLLGSELEPRVLRSSLSASGVQSREQETRPMARRPRFVSLCVDK